VSRRWSNPLANNVGHESLGPEGRNPSGFLFLPAESAADEHHENDGSHDEFAR
jgi:hypothetical protein